MRAVALASYLCQQRILFYLYAPTVVVGQMKMQLVHFVIRQHIDDTFNGVLVEKMAGNIQHHAAVSITRRVFYPHTFALQGAGKIKPDKLAQRAHGV